MKLSHKFVTSVPEILEDGVIYLSMEYATAIHKCCCGCGDEVVTKFAPDRWRLLFDGETISLYNSILNRRCRAHYWIRNSIVEWEFDRIEKSPKKEKPKKKPRKKKPKSGSFLKRLFRRPQPDEKTS